MVRRLSLLVLVVIIGCGAPVKLTVDAELFINDTTATQAQLWTLYQEAQTAIAAHPIELNPVPVLLNGATPVYVPANPKALDIFPYDVLKITEVQGNSFSCRVGQCYGETNGNTIEIASDWLLNAGVTGWEMQNWILAQLGYNVSGR